MIEGELSFLDLCYKNDNIKIALEVLSRGEGTTIKQ